MLPKYETPEAIVAGINKGDRNAETAMVKKYSGTLLYILEKRTQDKEKAKDLRQEALLVVLQKLRKESITDPSKLAAYLQNTAINLHIGEVRKEIRRQTTADTDTVSIIADSREDHFSELVQDRVKFAVRQVINELKNERDRKILILYYVEEKEKPEICEELELSIRHFDRVISRARSRFKALVKEGKEPLPLEVAS